MLKKFVKEKKGAVLITSALTMLIVFGFAAMSVDVSALLTARNQLQTAVDAAALSGASGLMVNQTEAEYRAELVAAGNKVMNMPVIPDPADIVFETSERIVVQRTQPVNLFFATIFGISNVNISASAEADLAYVGCTKKLSPFAGPELAWNPGQVVVIKAGSQDEPYTNPSFYFPVCYPPINRGTPVTGASIYERRIINGYEGLAYIGDDLLIEPGIMTGPTKKSIEDLLAFDPDDDWNGATIVDSDYGGWVSPRVIKVPMFDTATKAPAGRHPITISNLASFFLLPMQGNTVVRVFPSTITSGVTGNTPTHIRMVHLTN